MLRHTPKIKLRCLFAGKNQLHPSGFPWDIAKIFYILGALGMPGYAHLKYYYQLVESFLVYKEAKNQLHPLRFHGDIAKLCKLIILGTLLVPAYAYPIW